MLQRINEDLISHCELFGKGIKVVEKKIKSLIDIILEDSSRGVDYEFFDLKGAVLLYGASGIGKTTVMHNCISYALEKYGVECYELLTTKIVESELGKATKNLAEYLKNFEEKEKGILFIDELDRICVNRKYDEISELKRMLIEFMRFLDRQKVSNKKVTLCCTNVLDQMDEALIRRFSICEEIHQPEKTELIEFANNCMKKANMRGAIKEIKKDLNTFDDVKSVFRDALLTDSDIIDLFELEE